MDVDNKIVRWLVSGFLALESKYCLTSSLLRIRSKRITLDMMISLST